MGRFTHLEWKDGPGASRRGGRASGGGRDGSPGVGRDAASSGGRRDALSPGDADVPEDRPRDEAYWLTDALTQERAGRFEKALRSYSRALERDASLAAGWLGQVRMLVELGELDEACVWADKGLDAHRDHPGLLAAKAQAVARQGDAARAIALHDAAMKGKSATPEIWLARGEAILALGRGGEDHCFEKASIESRGDASVLAAAARIYMGYGYPAQALGWAEEAVRKDRRRAFAWRVQGEAESALGLADCASRSLRTALSLDQDCPGAAELLDALCRRSVLERIWLRVCSLVRARRSRPS